MQQHIKNLLRHIVIKKLASLFICCTFLLSITPKQVLHCLVAHHQDSKAKQRGTNAEVGDMGFNCDCNSVVATSPFTKYSEFPQVVLTTSFNLYSTYTTKEISSSTLFYYCHRGPPALS